MARYFKIVEVSADEFASATDEELDCCQLVVPTTDAVYVALDEESENYMEVSLDCFEDEHPTEKSTGFYDDAGGYHEDGCGWDPNGHFCGECSCGDCGQCRIWARDTIQEREE